MPYHRHLGHLPPDQLARVLADGGVKVEVVQWVKKYFECPVCKATIKPWGAAASGRQEYLSLQPYRGVDNFTHHFAKQPFDFLNVFCWDMGTMMVATTASKKALATRVFLVQVWVQPFGFMDLFIVDQGQSSRNMSLRITSVSREF